MPYEIGCVLIKNAKAHRDSFSVTPDYLRQEERGLAGGSDPINNYGLELSRGFKALKVWMSLKEHGIEKYIEIIIKNILQAFYLESLVKQESDLEMLAPVTMNLVFFIIIHLKLEINSTFKWTNFGEAYTRARNCIAFVNSFKWTVCNSCLHSQPKNSTVRLRFISERNFKNWSPFKV